MCVVAEKGVASDSPALRMGYLWVPILSDPFSGHEALFLYSIVSFVCELSIQYEEF